MSGSFSVPIARSKRTLADASMVVDLFGAKFVRSDPGPGNREFHLVGVNLCAPGPMATIFSLNRAPAPLPKKPQAVRRPSFITQKRDLTCQACHDRHVCCQGVDTDACDHCMRRGQRCVPWSPTARRAPRPTSVPTPVTAVPAAAPPPSSPLVPLSLTPLPSPPPPFSPDEVLAVATVPEAPAATAPAPEPMDDLFSCFDPLSLVFEDSGVVVDDGIPIQAPPEPFVPLLYEPGPLVLNQPASQADRASFLVKPARRDLSNLELCRKIPPGFDTVYSPEFVYRLPRINAANNDQLLVQLMPTPVHVPVDIWAHPDLAHISSEADGQLDRRASPSPSGSPPSWLSDDELAPSFGLHDSTLAAALATTLSANATAINTTPGGKARFLNCRLEMNLLLRLEELNTRARTAALLRAPMV